MARVRPTSALPPSAAVTPAKTTPAADSTGARAPAPATGRDTFAAHTPGPAVVTSGSDLFHSARNAFFRQLDHDPALRDKATGDAVGALLDVLARTDVPAAVEHAYTEKAGSVGGGRVLLALDYTRGIPSDETAWQALKQGPMHFLASKIVTPMLTHFRELGGASLFPGDATMTPAFRDSAMWGPKTNQVGHLLCAVEAGARLGRLSKHGLERRVFELGLGAANTLAGFHNVQGNTADWSRAGIIGHEMLGDQDGSGFIGQMKAYDTLVANGDPDHIRAHWDHAVAAVLRGDHAAAFQDINAISAAIQAPSTPAQVEANLADDHPRFAAPHHEREGNSEQDVALSVYGFAMGYSATTRGFETPAAAREAFEALFARGGSSASNIDRAAGVPD